MKIIKRSQLVIISLSFMIMIAGYINYRYNPEREEDLGQTVFVNSKDNFMYEDINIYNEKNLEETLVNTDDSIYKQKNSNTIYNMRSNRDDMFSELEENYSSVITASTQNVDQLTEYQNKLNELIKNKHLITIVEDLIKSKGIDDVVIVPTNENLNVILADKEEITQDKIAVVQKIIVDELEFSVDKITISVP